MKFTSGVFSSKTLMSIYNEVQKGAVRVHHFDWEPISSEMFQVEQRVTFDFPTRIRNWGT